MIAVVASAPAGAGDLVVPVTIAVAVTTIVAVIMFVARARRNGKLTRATIGLAAASGFALLAGTLLVGGSLTQPPTAAAVVDVPSRSATVPPVELKLSGLQLPTI